MLQSAGEDLDFEADSSYSKRHLLFGRELLELCLVQHIEIYVEIYFRDYSFYLFDMNAYFH
jgi:hypothetical protein